MIRKDAESFPVSMCVPELRCFQIRFFSLIWPWPFIKLGHRPACCSMDVYTFLQSFQMGRERHHANMSFSTSLQIDQANKTVNSGNLNRLSSSFIWWWCISLVIDNLVSLVCTPVCVCVCVCSNEANTPTCRQTPHRNTHTQTHTQSRKMRTIVIFVGINIPFFITVFFNSCSSSSSSFQILRLTHATFPCSHGGNKQKIIVLPVPPSAEMDSSGMFSCQHAQQCCPFVSCNQGDETVLQCGSRL